MQRLICAIFILLVFAPRLESLWARPRIHPNPVQVTQALLKEPEVRAGGNSTLELQLQLAPGYHAYSDQFHLDISAPDGAHINLQEISPLVEFKDKFSGQVRKGMHESGRILAVIDWPNRLPSQNFQAEMTLTYQACAADHCLLPKRIPIQVQATSRQAIKVPGIESLMGHGWRVWLIVFVAGLLTSLTPCIFPLIPITLAVISARGDHPPKRTGFLLSMAYVLGIAFTYAVLGLIAASTGKLFGAFLGHPVVVMALGILFVTLALSLLGWFTIETPLALTGRLFTHKTQGGYVGAFFAGNLAGVVASPCVGPVLAGILSYVAQTQNLTFGFGLLFVYALGLGQLFLLIGTFSGMRRYLPRSGPWMEATKYIFALSFFAMALFYVRPWLSEDQLWRAIGGVILLSLFKPQWLREKWSGQSLWRWAQIALVAGAGALLLAGAPQRWLTAGERPEKSETSVIPWVPYSDAVLEQARSEKMPVIIDFYADWCVACKELEKYTFSSPLVEKIAPRFLFVKFDATQSTPAFEELQKRYGIVGLPHLVFIDREGKWRQELTLTGFESADDFVKRLELLN